VRTAHGRWTVREGLLVRIERPDGTVGYGEAAPVPGFGSETVEADEAAARALGGWIAAESGAGPEAGSGDEGSAAAIAPATAERTVGPSRPRVRPRSAWSVVVGMVAEDLPCLRNALAQAMGDAESFVPVHASLGIAALLPVGRDALAVAAARAEVGFRCFKWKVGVGDIADELSLLDDLCAALPERARLRLDANGGWEPRQAERWLARCAERPVEFIEQPIAPDARGAQDRLLGLAHDYPVPLALDESIASDGDVERWLGVGWAGVWVIKPSLLADAAAALARLAAARADVVFSSALETGVGARAALEAAFAWPGREVSGAGMGSSPVEMPGSGSTEGKSAVPAHVPRALGFGVWPLFADPRFDGPSAVPVLRWTDVARLNPEALWNALS
jgi:O-succinylbenzoate synthase